MEPRYTPVQTIPVQAVSGRGRHRAVRRPVLAEVARATTEHVTAFAGRGAVVAAAGSGVLLSLVATPAQAAPSTQISTALASAPVQGALNATDLNALSAQARQAVTTGAAATAWRA